MHIDRYRDATIGCGTDLYDEMVDGDTDIGFPGEEDIGDPLGFCSRKLMHESQTLCGVNPNF